VANMEAHFRPLMSVEQYRYGYNNVAAHSHQHVVNVSILLSYLCLSILVSLSPIESMQVVQVPHLQSLSSLPSRCCCCSFVHAVLMSSVSSVGLIFASVWVDAVHISQERCVRHMKSQTRYRSVVY
jgi:hypothetical protein